MSLEKTEIINPMEVIRGILNRNNFKGELSHIEYSKEINEDHDCVITSSCSHDGTLLFTYQSINEVLIPLINKQLSDAGATEIKDTNYIIGDMTIKNEYGVKVRGFSGMKQTISLPIRIEHIF